MEEYRELPPPARLAGAVECFWSMLPAGGPPLHRVTPDGCADILFDGRELMVVGPMTGWRDFPAGKGERLLGMRFRPGMWTALLKTPGPELTDRMEPLESLWGPRAARLADCLAGTRSAGSAVEAMACAIPEPAPTDPLARALAWLERCRGLASMDELAKRAGLSPRQLRRVAMERTGLTPKFLARVLRFRHAQARLAAGRDELADLALECGYYDQAHFIHQYREFSGRTPAADGRFFQSPERASVVSSGS